MAAERNWLISAFGFPRRLCCTCRMWPLLKHHLNISCGGCRWLYIQQQQQNSLCWCECWYCAATLRVNNNCRSTVLFLNSGKAVLQDSQFKLNLILYWTLVLPISSSGSEISCFSSLPIWNWALSSVTDIIQSQ